MKERFDWDAFLNKDNKIAVRCETENEAEKFCELMNEHGLTWNNGTSYTKENFWELHKDETCYMNNGYYCCVDAGRQKDYKILKFSDFVFTGESEVIILNANFYKNEIDKLDGVFRVTKTTREIKLCGSCYDCIFSNTNKSCIESITEWLLLPYKPPKEKPVITDTVETFLKMCNPECYIARRKNGSLTVYDQKPIKSKTSWSYEGRCATIKETITKNLYEGFNFIKWEDDEPWKVADLLKIAAE